MKTISDDLERNSEFFLKISFFINIFKIWSLTDACYELRSYERGVAQLGSAGALGALGRRFESCRPDSSKPSYTREFPRLSFLLFTFSHEKGALGGALESSKI